MSLLPMRYKSKSIVRKRVALLVGGFGVCSMRDAHLLQWWSSQHVQYEVRSAKGHHVLSAGSAAESPILVSMDVDGTRVHGSTRSCECAASVSQSSGCVDGLWVWEGTRLIFSCSLVQILTLETIVRGTVWDRRTKFSTM
jgi:hypothetical protein